MTNKAPADWQLLYGEGKAYIAEHIPNVIIGIRITHAKTDSRIATCQIASHATLVVDALNALDPNGALYP